MAEDKEQVTIGIKTTNDPTGANQAASTLDTLKAKVNGASGAVELFGKLTRGLGAFAILQSVIALWQSLSAWINKAAADAEAAWKKVREANAVKAVSDVIEKYKELKDAVSAANDQLDRQARLEEDARKSERAREAARADYEEASALSKISPDDPERVQKESAVKARFADRKGLAAAAGEREDVSMRRKALEDSAFFKGHGATQLAAQAAETERLLQSERARQKNESELSELRKANSFWWEGQRDETPASKEHAANAEKAGGRADKLEAELKAQRAAAAAMAREAAAEREKADSMTPDYQAADYRVMTAEIAGPRAVKSADRDVATAQAKREAKAAETRRKEDELAAARRAASEAQSRIDTARGADAKESGDVFGARRALDAESERWKGSHNTRQRGRAMAPLQANYDKEVDEARAASSQLAAVMRAFVGVVAENTATVKRLEADLKRVKSQQANARGDASTPD